MFDSHPAEGESKVKSSEPVDAAALIAEALKRKFAHRYRRDSEREEGEDFKLPDRDRKPQTETPVVRLISCNCYFFFLCVFFFFSKGCWGGHALTLSRLFQFGQHMLKQTGRRKLI